MVASNERSGETSEGTDRAVRRWPVLAVVGVVVFLATLIDLTADGPLRDWDHDVIGTAHQAALPEPVLWQAVADIGGQVDHLAAGGRSWPSGHTAAGLALLLIAATLLARPGSRLDRIAYWTIPAIAAGVAAATVHLHYHWPTDAIAGWALGLTLGNLARHSLRRNTRVPVPRLKRDGPG